MTASRNAVLTAQGLTKVYSIGDGVQVYALRGVNRPIGVASWETELVRQLPDDFKGSLPTVEELEAELAGDEE